MILSTIVLFAADETEFICLAILILLLSDIRAVRIMRASSCFELINVHSIGIMCIGGGMVTRAFWLIVLVVIMHKDSRRNRLAFEHEVFDDALIKLIVNLNQLVKIANNIILSLSSVVVKFIDDA